MAKIKFKDIKDAFEHISFAPMYSITAFLNLQTGEIHFFSDDFEHEELSENIDDFLDNENYIEIPHETELNLGSNIVFKFTSIHLSGEIEKVHQFFRRKGAYSKFKGLLEQRNLLDEWYSFESEIQTKALLEWCKENNINVKV